MTDPSNTIPPEEKEKRQYSVLQSLFAAWLATYFMTQLSLHGVDFSVLNIDSEVVKATIIVHLIAFFGWATPRNIVDAMDAAIAFVRKSYRRLWKTATIDDLGQ